LIPPEFTLRPGKPVITRWPRADQVIPARDSLLAALSKFGAGPRSELGLAPGVLTFFVGGSSPAGCQNVAGVASRGSGRSLPEQGSFDSPPWKLEGCQVRRAAKSTAERSGADELKWERFEEAPLGKVLMAGKWMAEKWRQRLESFDFSALHFSDGIDRILLENSRFIAADPSPQVPPGGPESDSAAHGGPHSQRGDYAPCVGGDLL